MIKNTLVCAMVGFLWIFAWSLPLQAQYTPDQAISITPDQVLPLDPVVVKGKLSNGLTYYVRSNAKPEKRAQLWLVVNAGSVLEQENQRGLAHFVEHMAFNGTRNFEKDEIVNYLESVGMKFGPEINAYTSFDETVFMLQVPTDSIDVVKKGLEILDDWAQFITFDEQEIDKERGVIIEEWRLGRGAEMRMLDKQLPVLFYGSKYAERLPIGKKEVIESFPYSDLTRFYHDWYRPDLMAVIAVGDFDREVMEKMIIQEFSSIRRADNLPVKKEFPVPDHGETLVKIATDPEASNTFVSVYFKADPAPQQTVADYRRMLTEGLMVSMLNFRLYEKVKTADPPYLVAYAGRSSMVRTKDFYSLNAVVKENGILRGLEVLLTEAERVKQHGFTETELERAKTNQMRQLEQALHEKDKTQSQSYASEYSRNFLEGEPIPGIDYEFTLARELVPTITLPEVNALINKWITGKNRVILVNAPEKEGVTIPTEEEIMAVFSKVENQEVASFMDDVSSLPLVSTMPVPGKIKKERQIPELGMTEWILSNGYRIWLKPTDFQNDEVLFQGFSAGGTSLVPDSNFMSASVATNIIRESGLAGFSYTQLFKKLTGKVVSVFPYIGDYSEGLSGSASPADLETMFQLIYLYQTSPRKDQESYESYINRLRGFIENRSASPETALYDTLQVTLAQHHFRERPWSDALLEEISLAAAYRIYLERLNNHDAFTYVLVGNFDPEKIRPWVCTYLASLPAAKRKESWTDPGIYPPKGVVKKTVYRGIEPASQVMLVFNGSYPWSREKSYTLSSLTEAMQIKLREVLREDLSGTYGVSISGNSYRIPREEYRVSISFGCDPKRVDELVGTVFHLIDSMQTAGPGPALISKVKEIQKRDLETNLKENHYWLNQLVGSAFYQTDPLAMLKANELISNLSEESIRETAKQVFDKNNYIQLVLLPENMKSK